MTVKESIQSAELLLPGIAAPEDEIDPRWQAILNVSEFIETNPGDIWTFIAKWGRSDNEDLRTAVATCLLEHLLEINFESFFSLVEATAKSNAKFADTFLRCWKLGQANLGANSARWDSLVEFCSNTQSNNGMQRTRN